MDFKVESISPAKAVEYLRHNKDNYRKLTRSVYKRYADDMKNGRWQLNGEPIVFAEDGTLKDGQHRLAAIVESGKTIQMAVIRNVKDDVTVFDVGVDRTVLQMSRAEGIDANSSVVAVANIVVGKFGATPTKPLITNYISKNIDELNRAYRCTTYGTKPYSKKASCVTASYLMLRTKRMLSYEVELFFRLFNTSGSANAEGYDPSPVMVARRQFKGRENGGGLLRKEQLEILLMAMQDFHDGKSRAQEYKIKEPFLCEKMINEVRKMDGLS